MTWRPTAETVTPCRGGVARTRYRLLRTPAFCAPRDGAPCGCSEAVMGGAMRLLRIGADEASRLGQHWMGPEHTLLGILRGEPDDVARRAMEQAGVDAAMVEGWVTRMDPKKENGEKSGVTPNPRWQSIHARAEGIAAGLGAQDTGSVHFLLAALWDSRRWGLTEAAGVTREAIVAALAELGATLPLAPLPDLERKLNMTQYIEFPRSSPHRCSSSWSNATPGFRPHLRLQLQGRRERLGPRRGRHRPAGHPGRGGPRGRRAPVNAQAQSSARK